MNARALNPKRVSHLGAVVLLTISALVVVLIWIAVQSQRTDPLPTLVWAPALSDSQVMTASPMVLDRLGKGWWWIYGQPNDREALRRAGAHVAIAMPTPIAQMAGCSMPPLDVQIRP
jgi:hypothetical protein